MEFGVLGPLEVRAGQSVVDIRPGLPRTILAYLLLRRGETVGSRALTEVLWGDALPANPANALQTQISYLRKRFAAHSSTDPIVTRPGGYALDVTADAIDAHRFELAVRAGTRIDHADLITAEASLAALDAAMDLWRGPALADVIDHEFAVGEAARLEELRLVAVEVRTDLALALGRHRELIGELAALVNDHPFREKLHGQLMLSLYRSGRQAEALRAYGRARQALVDELGIEPGPELRDLERRILEQDPDLEADPREPSLAGAGQPLPPMGTGRTHGSSTRLPAAVTPLIGRDVELERVAAVLGRSRMVTLTGPAGAGKTRLAIETARRRSADSDTWFVDLGEVVEPDLVAAHVARALDVPTVPGDDTTASVAAAMSRRNGLLVLDTCEHVVGAAAVLVGRVLREADDLQVLATSRRPLNISGEMAWPVPPLALPPTGATAVGELERYPSIALFSERATAVRPDFVLTPDNATDVLAICAALDGLPLAIELAAAKVDVLSPRAISERLRHRFDLLVDGNLDVAPRQQTLRAAIEWSVQLLDGATRVFFARLGVFTGSFDLQAAATVGDVDENRALELLRSLVRQSMLTAPEQDRYRLLDTLGVYAQEMLDGLDADATRDRHANCYVELAERAERGIQTEEQQRWLGQLRADLANHRAALEWLVSTGDGAGAARLAGALGWFWTLDGMLADADRQLERVLGFDDLSPRERSKVLWSLALLASSLGQMERAEAFAVESVVRGREAGDPVQTAYGLNAVAVVQWADGDLDASEASRAEAIDLFERSDESWGLAVSLVLRARTAIDRDRPEARALVAEGLAAARATGDRHLVGIALEQAARLAHRSGDPDGAVRRAIESLEASEAIGYTEGILGALHLLGLSSTAVGRPEVSCRHHLRALRLAVSIGHAAAVCEAVEGLAHAALAAGRADRAAELVTVADQRRTVLGLPRRADDEKELASLVALIGRDHRGREGDEGEVMASFEETVEALLARHE